MDEFNEHWKVVNMGATVVSTTPQQLWEAAIDYFQWVDNHPITYNRVLTSGKDAGKKISIEAKRPYNIKAFCLHCCISEKWIDDIKNTQAKDSDWYMVIEKVLMIIYTDNLEGALVDLYNSLMTSKVLKMDQPNQLSDEPVKVTIVDSRSNELSNSENEILQKLDYGKLDQLNEKIENTQR